MRLKDRIRAHAEDQKKEKTLSWTKKVQKRRKCKGHKYAAFVDLPSAETEVKPLSPMIFLKILIFSFLCLMAIGCFKFFPNYSFVVIFFYYRSSPIIGQT